MARFWSCQLGQWGRQCGATTGSEQHRRDATWHEEAMRWFTTAGGQVGIEVV
jgi:hypothetical protein